MDAFCRFTAGSEMNDVDIPIVREALSSAQSALSMTIEPNAIVKTSVISAYAACVAAEAKTRAAISLIDAPRSPGWLHNALSAEISARELLVAKLAEQDEKVDALREALTEIYRALMKDSRQKSVVNDDVEYHLDGPTMYFALNKARRALEYNQ